MSPPRPPVTDVRHPRLRMHGPRASLPLIKGAGSGDGLPFAPDGDRGRAYRGPRWLLAAVVVLAVLVAGVLVAGHDGSSDDRASTPSPTTEAGPKRPTTTRSASTTSSTTTTSTTTTTAAPAPTVPVEQLPPHEAVYRDGKLFLQGTLPNQAVADRFRAEADAVIGPGNVVMQYQFDPRVPEPTDGRVRVDERFVFAKGSAEVDPAYLPVFDLGVIVMRINPQATMRIRGYTDDRGSVELNMGLSRARAQAAADYLAANGIDPARLTVEGLGPADPVAANDTPEGRSENRRIEVDLFNLLG